MYNLIAINGLSMKVEKKYVGKWVAIKNEKIIDSDITLGKLSKKTEVRKDKDGLRFTLVPNGFIAG
jgi:hypothetical protein